MRKGQTLSHQTAVLCLVASLGMSFFLFCFYFGAQGCLLTLCSEITLSRAPGCWGLNSGWMPASQMPSPLGDRSGPQNSEQRCTQRSLSQHQPRWPKIVWSLCEFNPGMISFCRGSGRSHRPTHAPCYVPSHRPYHTPCHKPFHIPCHRLSHRPSHTAFASASCHHGAHRGQPRRLMVI